MSFDIFRERCAQILSVPPELTLYQRWLEEQRAEKGTRDYLFSEAQPRFEPRQNDVVVALPALSVQRTSRGTCLSSARLQAVVELPGVSCRDAERVLAALDGTRCLLEARWHADVDERVMAQFLRPTFGVLLFAPASVAQLEARISGVEITRFPGAPYSIERPYWENMVDVRQHLVANIDALGSEQDFVALLRELHVLALMGRNLSSYYKPASPVSDRVVAPGAFYSDSPRLMDTSSGTIFLDGPRVNVSLLGGSGYHRHLYASVGDDAAMSEGRSFENDGVSWGRFVMARSARDDAFGAWFCPPRPIQRGHWQQLHALVRAAEQAARAGDADDAIRSLAGAHQRFVRLHPFHCANQSIAMNVVNALLAQVRGAGIPHLILDHLALRLSESAYARVFARAVDAFVVEGDPASRLATLLERKVRSFALIESLGKTTSALAAQAVVEQQPDAARWALVSEQTRRDASG